MPSSMLVHDTRLAGTAPSIAPNTFRISEKNRVRHVFGWISQYARSSGGLSRLMIMCHGLESGVEDGIEGVSTTDLGFGLHFGKEGLTLANVAEASVLKGLVQTIVVYACGPARTRRGFAGTQADGRRFCSEFAAYADAELFAPSDTQYYSMGPPNDFLRRIFGIGPQDIIDFGPWEGRLSRFSPDGTITEVSSL